MNKVFKKNKCRYASTGLFKRFQDKKWTVDWSQRIEDALQSLVDSDYNSQFLCDWTCDPLGMGVEESLLS